MLPSALTCQQAADKVREMTSQCKKLDFAVAFLSLSGAQIEAVKKLSFSDLPSAIRRELLPEHVCDAFHVLRGVGGVKRETDEEWKAQLLFPTDKGRKQLREALSKVRDGARERRERLLGDVDTGGYSSYSSYSYSSEESSSSEGEGEGEDESESGEEVRD